MNCGTCSHGKQSGPGHSTNTRHPSESAGTSEVDAEFLKEIEGWRDVLWPGISRFGTRTFLSDDLNAAVQMTIDRVVFLRMAEDRGLESQEQLLKLCERPDIYPRFMRDLCRKADAKYNSGLFHFQKEEGISEAPDRITPKLTVDDKVFKPILRKSVLCTRFAVRLRRDARRNSRHRLRAISRQGHPADNRAPSESRGKA